MGLTGSSSQVTPTAERAVTLQSAAGATGNGTAVTFAPTDKELMVFIAGAAAVLTLAHEATFDGGSTWESAFLQDLLAAGGLGTLLSGVASPGAKSRLRYVRPAGCTGFRSRVSVYVSGTVTVSGVVLGGG